MKARSLLWLGLFACAAAQADSLGRLFHTPEQRAVLDQVRRGTPAGALAADNSPADGSGVTVNGIVTRSDGQRSTWVNGHLEHGGGKESNSQRMRLPNGDVRLKVGQHIDPATGQVTESYRRPPPPAAPAKPEAPPPATQPAKKKPTEARDDDATTDDPAR